jgi:hypothetical protein
MKDPVIEQLVLELQDAINRVNSITEKLQDLNVEVRIAYVDPKSPENMNKTDIKQGIKVWRIEEHNDYL